MSKFRQSPILVKGFAVIWVGHFKTHCGCFCVEHTVGGNALFCFVFLAKELTKDDLVTFVKEASEFAKKAGRDAAIKEFQNKEGKFFRNNGELYIFAYDNAGVNLALPTKPALAGKNLIGLKDPNGFPMIEKFVELSKSNKPGFVEYSFDNPVTKKVDPKLSYIIPMGGWLIGSGVYIPKK